MSDFERQAIRSVGGGCIWCGDMSRIRVDADGLTVCVDEYECGARMDEQGITDSALADEHYGKRPRVSDERWARDTTDRLSVTTGVVRPLRSDERWARDSSGLCGRRCGATHYGSGHGDYALCVNEIGHSGPHRCGRSDHEMSSQDG